MLGAADKARLVRGEEQHQLGAFLRRALAVQRDRGARGMGKGLAAALEKAGIGDLPGMDRIDPDVPRRELQHRGLGQPAQPPFARGVGGVVMRGQPGGRGDVDDRAAAAALRRIADRRRAMLHAEQRPGQIDRDRAVPRLERRVDDALPRDRAGIVDQDVQPAELRQRRRDDLSIQACSLGRVVDPELRLAALPPRQPLRPAPRRRRVDIGQHHRGALAHEQFGFGDALPARGPGDQRDLPVSLAISRLLPALDGAVTLPPLQSASVCTGQAALRGS